MQFGRPFAIWIKIIDLLFFIHTHLIIKWLSEKKRITTLLCQILNGGTPSAASAPAAPTTKRKLRKLRPARPLANCTCFTMPIGWTVTCTTVAKYWYRDEIMGPIPPRLRARPFFPLTF